MYRRRALLQLAFIPLRLLKSAKFRLDRVTAVFAIHAFRCRVRLGHGRVDGELALGLDLFFYLRDHLLVLLPCEPLFAQQIFLKAIDAVALAPVLVHLFGDVSGGVVDGVALHAHQLGLDQRRSFAAMGALDGFIGRVENLTSVGTVDDHARNAVADRAIGEIFHRDLIFGRRGVSPKIALDDQHQTQLTYRSKVDAFVADAGGLPAVADPGETRQFLALQARAERDAGHHRQQIAEHGYGR